MPPPALSRTGSALHYLERREKDQGNAPSAAEGITRTGSGVSMPTYLGTMSKQGSCQPQPHRAVPHRQPQPQPQARGIFLGWGVGGSTGFSTCLEMSSVGRTISTPFQPHFNPISTPFQPHCNPIATPFQPHSNLVLTPTNAISTLINAISTPFQPHFIPIFTLKGRQR